MKRKILSLIAGLVPFVIHAQNVGIGTANPLEKLHVAGNIRSNTLAGTGTRIAGADANGTLVIVSAGTNGQVLTQTAGGPAWQSNTGWLTTGNAGTLPASNFVGTTDAADLAFRTNSVEGMRLTTTSRLGVGTTTPSTKLEVNSGTGDAIYGHSNNVGAYLGYETNFSFGSPVQNILGAGVFANNPGAGYTSLYSQSTGAATIAASINYSDVWIASYNYVQNGSTANPPAIYGQLNITNSALAGTQVAMKGYNFRGATTGNPGVSVGVQGIANADNQRAMGVMGLAYSDVAFNGIGPTFGGYFEGLDAFGNSYAYAYVGGNSGVANRKIIGTGTVSEIIPTPTHGRVTLTCPESPEYWYVDYGSVNLVNGTAHVNLDPILADIINVNAQNPIRVFCTPVNMLNFNGVAVMNQTASGFDLIELNGGTHTGKIDYQLVVKPKTNYGEGRFPQAPGPYYMKPSDDPAAARTANQVPPGSVYRWPADHVQYHYNPNDFTPVGDMIPAGQGAGKTKLANGNTTIGTPAQKP